MAVKYLEDELKEQVRLQLAPEPPRNYKRGIPIRFGEVLTKSELELREKPTTAALDSPSRGPSTSGHTTTITRADDSEDENIHNSADTGLEPSEVWMACLEPEVEHKTRR